MLEQLGDKVKKGLRGWTERMVGEDRRERLQTLARTENEYGVDPFGFNLDYSMAAVAPLVWMYRHYFRVETFGMENVPAGRVLLVANHSGQIPLDGAMIGVAMMLEGSPPRAIRSMVEKWVPTLPYVSTFMARIGQIVGTPENCRRLLAANESILVFPEGVRGLNKLWPQRYQLQEFGLGFMRSMDNRHREAGQMETMIIGRAAFGHAGAGGSVGFADPETRLAFGYSMNRMGAGILLNERGQALVDATYRALGYRTNAPGAWIR